MGERSWASEVRGFASESVGVEFEISLATCGDDPRTTLIVTDADGLFGLAVDSVRLMQIPAMVPPMLVVGIGYRHATSLVDTIESRTRDLTPTAVPAFAGSGGGGAFAGFLESELRPWLADLAPAATAELTYFGHSLGGLFGTHLMLTRPGLFDRYILSSPSLWWDDGGIFDTEAAVATSRDDLSASVVFGIGGLETDAGRRLEGRQLPDGHPAKPPAAHLDMVEVLDRFVTRLAGRRHPGLQLRSIVIPDEFHATVPAVVLTRALRWFHRSDG